MNESTGQGLALAADEPSQELLELQAAALAATANAVVITDRESNIVWVNAAFEQLTGYSRGDAVGQTPRLLKSGANPVSLYQELWGTITSGKRWRGELVNRRKDGSLYTEEMTVTPLRDQAGEIAHFVAIKQDITERKKAERELRFKTALLESQSEATLDGILAVDEAGKVVLSNRHFGAIWRIPRELMLAADDKRLREFVTDQIEDPRAFLEEVEFLYANREEKSRDDVRLKDGRLLDRYSSPLIDSAGAYRGRIWYFRDVTASKRAEEKLRVSEEQFRQLAENVRQVFFILTPEPLQVAYISPAYEEIWGRPRQEVYDWPPAWIELVHAEDRERVSAYYERCLQGFQLQIEYRISRPDGAVRWIDVRSFPVRDEAGKFVRLVGIAEDITERKKEERVLAETHEKLNAALRKAEDQAHDSTKLTELVDILQSCQTVEEAYAIAASVLPGTFSAPAGALCITSPARNSVEAVSVWGAEAATEKAFAPDGCWALRRGKANLVKDAASPMRCPHVLGFPKNGYLCAPLAAQGETLGVLYLEFPPADAAGNADPVKVLERQVTAVGERLSLALANLRLREALQQQSIRDNLTGLYNRRFMEESLQRELGRAARTSQPVSMIMMDIDHFKRFNDTFGHQAGDALLKALGEFVNQRTRGQDVACRYGGEEFSVILTGCSLENACKRGQVLREELKMLKVRHGGQSMGAITLSMGIASFPTQANNAETLVKAADDALYRAKKEGRDRIVAAEGEVGSSATSASSSG